jgi:hypothetical protein
MAERRMFLLSRRGFVTTAGAALGAAANASSVTPALAYDPGGEETRARYRDSAHVRTFYRVNGYETASMAMRL